MELKYQLLKLKQVIVDWINYYKLADMKTLMGKIDSFLRGRVRSCIRKSWEKIKKRLNLLNKLT